MGEWFCYGNQWFLPLVNDPILYWGKKGIGFFPMSGDSHEWGKINSPLVTKGTFSLPMNGSAGVVKKISSTTGEARSGGYFSSPQLLNHEWVMRMWLEWRMENLIQSLFLLSKGLAFTYSMQNFKADSFTLYLHFSAKSTLFVIFTASTVKLKHKYEIEIVKHILHPITHMWVIFQLPPADKMSITH